MKQIVMTGPGTSRVEETPIPSISENELLVKVIYTGMCHSEWYPWYTAKAGETFGHEPVGIVAEVGSRVKGFQKGDRVSGLASGYAEYIVMKPERTIHVPDNISDEDAVIEPLSCILSGAERVPVVTPGCTVAVVGAGYMGLGMISLLKLKGAGKIIAVDPRREALENALHFGATEVYTPGEVPKQYLLNWETMDQDLSKKDMEVDLFHTGVPIVVEFTGQESGLRLAGDMVSAHGFLGVGGYHNDCDRSIDFKLWNFKSFTLENLHERRNEYQAQLCQKCMDLLASGQWGFTGLSRHIYEMEEFDQANHDMDQKPQGYIKALVRCSDGKI